MIIHSFDPGFNTGYVKFDTTTMKLKEGKVLTNEREIMQVIFSIKKKDLVIIENRHGTLSTEPQFVMCELVGYIKYTCDFLRINRVCQSPLVRRGYLVTAKKIINQRHLTDAMAHVLRFIDKELII